MGDNNIREKSINTDAHTCCHITDYYESNSKFVMFESHVFVTNHLELIASELHTMAFQSVICSSTEDL